MAQNFGIQPDFAAAAQSMHATASELEKCNNLPAIHEGSAIVNVIQAVETRLQAMDVRFQAMESRLQAMDVRFQAMESRLQAMESRLSAQIQTLSTDIRAIQKDIGTLQTDVRAIQKDVGTLQTDGQVLSNQVLASEYNNTARLQNRMLHASDSQLTGLHNMDNSPINSFPATPAALHQLKGLQLTELLVALNMSTDGTVELKRSRLRVAIGLRDTPAP